MESSSAHSHRQVLRILSGVLVGMFLAALDQTIIATALPTIAADLSGIEHLSWVVSIYLLTSTASTPIYGKLSDLYGRRRLLQIGITIFMLGSLLCVLAQTMSELIAARAIQGLGGGGLITLAHATVADHVSPRERGRYQGYLSSVWASASVGGPMLGGLFVDYLSWRWVFGINLPIGVVAITLCRRALPRIDIHHEQRRIDYIGATLLTLAVTALLLVTTWGGTQYPWLSPTILGLVAAGILLLVVFALQELRTLEPILPPRLFGDIVFRVANTVSFLISMVTFGSTMLLPVFFQMVAGRSPAGSGLLMAPFTGATVIGAFVTGQLMRKTGRYKRFPLFGLAAGALAFVLLATLRANTSALTISGYMILLGLGVGTALPVMLVSVQNAADPRDIGAATSAVNFFRSMGGAFGAATLWSVLIIGLNYALEGAAPKANSMALLQAGPDALAQMAPRLRSELAPALLQAFHDVFMVGAVLVLASLAMTTLLKERPLRTSTAIRAPAD
ncbi:MAG TPA: MDR family MFS transporter [Stellaceae bacterium]|nr:MDR family MFS transporter [Stellaceae bacterium]